MIERNSQSKAERRILILGAASGIAQAYARLRAAGNANFVLLGRQPERLVSIGNDLLARGAATAESVTSDLGDVAAIDATVSALKARFGAFDEIIVAYGVLGNQAEAEKDTVAARKIIDVNFTSVALWVLALLHEHPAGQPLSLVGIGSVAGDRGRASNFVYGASKAGLERLLEGLAQKYADSDIHILTVKPGFVDTPMTAGMVDRKLLLASPEQVARDVQRAVSRRQRVVYTPWFWWVIMLIIRNLPWFVFKRLKI
jgi:decaprenylphospho-beta-D-erythro-pentofuranosid-2-ulose 2-reductase